MREKFFIPPSLYYEAGEEMTDRLIEKLTAADSGNEGSRLMSCLAMAGGKKAQDALYELKRNPRPWRKSLYVDSDIYAEEGGWTFDSKNDYIKLNYDKCYSFRLRTGKK